MKKIGKKAPRHDPRTLTLAKYLGRLPRPPAHTDWASKVKQWPMYRNDEIGDCTCAAAGHLIQAWTEDARGAEVDVTDDDVLAMYEAVGGYDPNDPSTDQGAVELDVLKYWRTTGIAGHKIGAFVSIPVRSRTMTQDGIYLFGGIYIGLALPVSAQDAEIWSVPLSGPTGDGEPGSWGGHAVPVLAYDASGLVCVTWGGLKRMTWDFFQTYCDESYAILSPDFISGLKAPNGFDIATLQRDLALL